MNVLAVGAHPDDLEILAAGALARYATDGHHVAMCVMTNGELGSDTATREDIAVARRAEAEASARLLGAQLHWLDQPDGFLYDTPVVRRALVDVMRSTDPDLVLAHAPEDYHPDHRAASQITLNCRQLGPCGLLETSRAATSRIPAVLYMDTLTGTGFQPELWVDISDTIDTKRAMLRCHHSQNDWMRRLHAVDYIDYVDTQGALRGVQAGTRYAEAFRVPHVYPERHDVTALLPHSSRRFS